MLVVEKHQVKQSHPDFKEIDRLSLFSRNLYNTVIYIQRQEYFEYGKFRAANPDKSVKFKWTSYKEVAGNFAKHNQADFRALPAKVSQHVIKQAFQAFSDMWKAIAAKNPEDSRPGLPHYKKKLNERNILLYTDQAVSKKRTEKGYQLSGTNIFIPVRTKNKIHQIRIIPTNNRSFTIEVVYERHCKKHKNNNRAGTIDIGLNNLAAITTNTGASPLLIPGGPAKSINQFYNKKKAECQQQLPNKEKGWSNRLSRLTRKRNNKISDYLHKVSRYIINYLVSQNITTLVIGRNKDWKQGINIGKKNNQNFVDIPFVKLIQMLTYKAELLGIRVMLNEESYTSKCSFLDQEEICKHETYCGRRIKRGLFRTSSGQLINADCNGSANIMRKAIPNVEYTNGIEAVVVQPRRVKTSAGKSWTI